MESSVKHELLAFGEKKKISAIVIILTFVSHLHVVLALIILHFQVSFWNHCSFCIFSCRISFLPVHNLFSLIVAL